MMRENKTYEEIKVGDEASIKRVLTANDLYIFAHASGNLNPMHLPKEGDEAASRGIVAPSMWVGALISSVLGNVLPGAGTLYKAQTLKFLDRAHVGDELTVKVHVLEKRPGNVVMLATSVARDGETLAEGVAEVVAPIQKVRLDDSQAPNIVVKRHQHFDNLIAKTRGLEPLRTAVVAPEAEHALAGAIMAAEQDIIVPILVGDRRRIEEAAKAAGCSTSRYEIVEASSGHEAAAKSVALVHAGRVELADEGTSPYG